MDRAGKRRKGLPILIEIQRALDLSCSDLGMAFGTTGEAVRGWESDSTEIPDVTLARIVAAHGAVRSLEETFRPERLPQVIRRRAPVFNGERALDWILDGRIAEVAERYQRGLSYLGRTA